MKGQQRFLLGIFASALALLWAGGQETGFAAGLHAADHPATHNMLVVGEEAVYLSHLPMFQEEGKPPMPHRYQVILEVTFAEEEDYANDRRGHPATTIYTLNPEEFVLPDLVSLDPRHESLREFKANTIFRGHLEREGSVPILEDVGLSVKRVIHFREFDPKAEKRPQLEYLLFGKGQELYMAHRIVAPPDFDQVLSVKVTGHQFSDEELAQGVPVIFPEMKNTATERLRANQQAVGEVKAGSHPTMKEIQVEVGGELYFEEGELRLPPDSDPTPEEKQVGFP